VFSVVSCSSLTDSIIDTVAGDDIKARELLQREHCAFSGIFGPDGRLLSEPLIDREGIAYAEIDLRRCIQPKQMHDIVGHYNRFDVFGLLLDKRRKVPLMTETDRATRKEYVMATEEETGIDTFKHPKEGAHAE